MLHKFKVKNTGTIFYYCNEHHLLYDKNKKLLFPKLYNDDEDIRETSIVEYTKTNKPTSISFVLGMECNLSCIYCIQNGTGGHKTVKTANEVDAENIINQITTFLDLSDVEQIEFTGGEVFLWWDTIQKLCSFFDNTNLTMVFVTNGTLLRREHLDFLKTLKSKIMFEISHDGPVQHITRKGNLQNLVPLLHDIEQSSNMSVSNFMVMLSRHNADMKKIITYFDDFYTQHGLTPISLTFQIVNVYDKLSFRNSLIHSKDLFEKTYAELYKNMIHEFKTTNTIRIPNNAFSMIDEKTNVSENGIIYWSRLLRGGIPKQNNNYRCSSWKPPELTIDRDGNILACMNTPASITNVNLHSFKTNTEIPFYKNDISDLDNCSICPAQCLCSHGCPLVVGSEYFKINCIGSWMYYFPQLLACFHLIFGNEVEYIGDENGNVFNPDDNYTIPSYPLKEKPANLLLREHNENQ